MSGFRPILSLISQNALHCRVQVLEASRRVSRKELSVVQAAAETCAELGVYDSNGEPAVDQEAAHCFRTLVVQLLMRSDKETAVRLTAAVLPFVEEPLPFLNLDVYPRAEGRSLLQTSARSPVLVTAVSRNHDGIRRIAALH